MGKTNFEVTAAPELTELQVLLDGLESHSAGIVPPLVKQKLAVFQRENEKIIAGLYGETYWGWFYIKYLWVADSLRGKGVGRALVLAAEEEARRRECRHSFVNTFSYQAPRFYERLGYTLFGQLEDFPAGQQRLFLRKTL